MANGFVLRKGLISLGGVRLPLIEINDANYSIDADTDYYIDVTASSSNRTMTLPTPVEGLNLIIKNNFNSSQKVIVDGNGNTIDGESTITLSVNESLQIITNGTNWLTISETGGSLGAGCYDTNISNISGSQVTPADNNITIDNSIPTNTAIVVDTTQNGIDITSLLSQFENESGLITITDSSDNFTSITPQAVQSATTYYRFTIQTNNFVGTNPMSLDLGSAVICFTPFTNGTSGSSGSSGTSGSSGSSGTSGSSGSSGTSGSSGSSGTSGSSGSSGTSGSSGSSGTSGSSGSSGTIRFFRFIRNCK